jgi:hypothetical protein
MDMRKGFVVVWAMCGLAIVCGLIACVVAPSVSAATIPLWGFSQEDKQETATMGAQATRPTTTVEGIEVIQTGPNDYTVNYTRLGNDTRLVVGFESGYDARLSYEYTFDNPETGDYIFHNPTDERYLFIVRVSVIRGHEVFVGHYR